MTQTTARLLTSVNEQEGYGTLDFALLVHIVYIQGPKTFHLDIPSELRKLVDGSFDCPPIKISLPPLNQSPYVGQR